MLPQNRTVWVFVFIVALALLTLVFISSLYVDAGLTFWPLPIVRQWIGEVPFLENLLTQVGEAVSNDAILSAVIAILSAAIPLSIVYAFQMPALRKISVRILVDGYYENFLSGVIADVYQKAGNIDNRIGIVLPGYRLVTDKKRYWTTIENVIQRKGFTFETHRTDKDFGRSVFVILNKQGEKLPVYLDLPTTLTGLNKVIEFETGQSRGDLSDRKWSERRFYFLRDLFRTELEKYVVEDDWGNIKFLEGKSLKVFEAELSAFLEDLEQQDLSPS
jgi:hypothetical protein